MAGAESLPSANAIAVSRTAGSMGMSHSGGPSITPQPVCPSIMRALFNYIGFDYQVEQGTVTVRPRLTNRPGSELREYFDAAGMRVVLAQRKRGSTDQWDPKAIWIDGVGWRNYMDQENHRCNICVLAATRPPH